MMNKTNFLVIAFALVATGCSAIAADEKRAADDGMIGNGRMGTMMMKMDGNADGMLSKAEFMKGHEQMFDRMKGQNGMIAMNDMPMNCMSMMGRSGMTGKGHPMPDHIKQGKETNH